MVVRQRRSTENVAYVLRTCAPEMPPNGHQQPASANSSNLQTLKLARALNFASNARDTLVMRRSLGGDGDEDQGAEAPTVVRDRRRRDRCVPDRLVNAGTCGHSRACPLRARHEEPLRTVTVSHGRRVSRPAGQPIRR